MGIPGRPGWLGALCTVALNIKRHNRRLVPGGADRDQKGSATGRDDGAVIGRLEKTVFDCPEPRDLAAFYAAVLGMRVNEDDGDWVVIGIDTGDRHLAFQRSPAYVPPQWPDPTSSQQLHLDIRVDDIDEAEQAVVALGARRVPAEVETGFRVFLDPVGHPFCLVFGKKEA